MDVGEIRANATESKLSAAYSPGEYSGKPFQFTLEVLHLAAYTGVQLSFGETVMIARKAACHCGDLTLVCEGEPAKISMCHCPDCQRRTGSAFSIAAFYPREKITVSGSKPSRWERQSASGFPVVFHFCGRCGSNLFWEPARMPDRIGVAVGAFADPHFPVPHQSVSSADKHAWVCMPEGVVCFDFYPPRPAIEAT